MERGRGASWVKILLKICILTFLRDPPLSSPGTEEDSIYSPKKSTVKVTGQKLNSVTMAWVGWVHVTGRPRNGRIISLLTFDLTTDTI